LSIALDASVAGDVGRVFWFDAARSSVRARSAMARWPGGLIARPSSHSHRRRPRTIGWAGRGSADRPV